MAKTEGSGGKSGAKTGGKNAADMIPDGLRDAGRRAAEMAQNPYARSLLAAGLVAAAAALAANKTMRSSAKKTARKAQSAAEAAADAAAESANSIGAAMINAATEAVRRMMGEQGPAKAAAKPRAKAPAARKPAKPAATSLAAKPVVFNAAAGARRRPPGQDPRKLRLLRQARAKKPAARSLQRRTEPPFKPKKRARSLVAPVSSWLYRFRQHGYCAGDLAPTSAPATGSDDRAVVRCGRPISRPTSGARCATPIRPTVPSGRRQR